MKTCIIIGAGGRGKDSYAPIIKENNLFSIVGVADPDLKKREEFKKKYNISDSMCFAGYKELFEHEKLADAVIICTQDRMHLEPTLLAKEKGYHILLEKPLAPTLDDILLLEDRMKDYDKVFMTGFVLRYTPFIEDIKCIIDSGIIGEIITMQLNENEGFWHHAHSYVRGPWSKAEESSPLIVAKSCHDFDLMLYLINSPCISVSSYGSNKFFRAANMPKDVPDRCTEGCRCENSCEYNAVRLYTEGQGRYFIHKFGCADKREDIINELKVNPYGRCVYKCDNDVCDHQVVCMEFANKVTAMFTVSAFSLENNRTIKIMGTNGEIGGCMEKGTLTVKTFLKGKETIIKITNDGTWHCGGDGGLMRYFSNAVNKNEAVDKWMFESHKIAFAAEQSRIEGKEIKLV